MFILKLKYSNNYTKTEVDTALALKANQATTYTKTENDTALALKANQATTYTKTEVDTAVNDKVSLTGTDQTMTGKLTAITLEATTLRAADPNDSNIVKDITTFLTGGGGYADGETDTLLNGKIDRVSGVEQSVSSDFAVLGVLKTHTVNTSGDVDITFLRNNVLFLTLDTTTGVSSINASQPIKCDVINTNTINTDGDVNLNFQQNSVNFMYFDAGNDKIELNTALNSTSDIASTILKGETLSNYNVNGLSLDTDTNSIYIKNNTATKIEVQSAKIIVSDPLECI